MNIKEHFKIYADFKQNKEKLRHFNFLDTKISLIKYLKENKSLIIKSINYAFFESNEPYLLSAFSGDGIHFVHINSKLSKEFPPHFETQNEYENFLAIYATFGILIEQNFQVQDLSDSRLNIHFKDFLSDLTFKIYYDDAFRLNLENYIQAENEVLKYVYRYGYDYLFVLFRAYFNEKLEFDFIAKLLKLESNELEKLYRLYKTKILVDNE